MSALGQRVLRLLGGGCALAGGFAWVSLAWMAIADIDRVTPESEEGWQLMVRGVSGTVLMILGGIFLHIAQDAENRGTHEERTPPD